MKKTTKTLLCQLTMMVMLFMAVQPAHAQFGALRGIAKKAKVHAEEAVNSSSSTTTSTISNATDVSNTASSATPAPRGAAPWPMSGGQYKGKGLGEFLYGINDFSDEELTALRDQYLVRYRGNLDIISEQGYTEAANIATQENQNLLRMLYELRTIVSSNVMNVQVSYQGAIDGSNARYLITNRKGAGIGNYVMEKNGQFTFVTLKDDGAFLDAEDLATAKDAAVRMRKYATLTYGLNDILKADASNYDVNLGVMYNLCSMYANAVEKACDYNKPENIERKPRPVAGALHASMKAQALAVAKADDPDVVDVIITSGQWDVKMRGAVPVNRNIYGYYIYKDEHGLQCCSRMWTEDYVGNGKYGKLRKGGVGVGSPFYIK